MSIDAWGEPTPDHMKPLNLTEDRSPEQLAADGDARAQPAIGERCATCDQRLDAEDARDAYHAAMLEFHGELVEKLQPFTCGVHSTLYDPGVCADCDCVRVQRAEQALLTVAREYDEEWLRASIGGARCFPNHPEAQRDVRLYQAMLGVKGLKARE